MGSPYTSQSISGYNSSPPSDDGQETSANTVKWATHKTKLSDPIKTLAEAINTQIVTAFGLIFGQSFSTHSTNYSVATSDQGKTLVATAAMTFTLPAVGTVNDCFPVLIVNASDGNVTVDGNASETLQVGEGAATSVTLRAGQSVLLTTDGSSWAGVVTDPGPQLKNATDISYTNDTTFADITGLTGFVIEGGATYEFEAVLYYTQGGGDIKVKCNLSQTPVESWIGFTAGDESYTSVNGVVSSATTGFVLTTMTDSENVMLVVKGKIRAHATTDGTLALQAAQNSSNSSPTTIDGGKSFMRVRRLS